MKHRNLFFGPLMVVSLLFSVLANAYAGESLQCSCSNQVYNAFEKEKTDAFTEKTGIAVEVFTSSSNSAIYRMMHGYSDIAATARQLHPRSQSSGYHQIAVCKDPLAVIVKGDCGVTSLSVNQLIDVFSGKARNWKELGGKDQSITVIVPHEDTAANRNFRRQVMKHAEISPDFIANNATMAIEAVKNFPCGSVSFISQGATTHHPRIRSIKIDGHAPDDPDYPYFQTFYYVTKGEPVGSVKEFIDFTFSAAGLEIIRKNGMLPISR